MLRRYVCALAMVAAGLSSTSVVTATQAVPFKGTWTGVTVSADLSTFPVVQILAAGNGEFTHFGRSAMVSPHTTNVFTGETLGDQVFTAANGDTLTAFCAGFPVPGEDGIVRGTLTCEVREGTGRFAGASGAYTFTLTASPITLPDGGLGFSTVAEISGWILY